MTMDPRDRPVLRMHLWLETQRGIFFGLGRMKLLEKIQSGQSLRGAAKSLGMSYRAAWGKIKNTEEVLGVTLIEKKAGNRAGYQLTQEGLAMVARFGRWFKDVEGYALRRAGALLPCDPLAFEETSSNHSADSPNEPGEEAFLP
jgi:molybdate transport system regulatory protein